MEKKLSRRDAYVQRFVFGNGNWKESSQIVELPVYFGGKYHKVQCRLIEGSTELLLGRIWCEDNDVVIRVKNNEIQFGKSGCWEKLLVNNKGHLVLPLDPALWYCNSVSKGRTSRRRKREKRMLRDFRNKEMIDSSDILGAEESMNLLAQDRVQDLKRIDVFFCEIGRQIDTLKEDFKNNKKNKKKRTDFKDESCSTGVKELERCSEVDHGRAVLGAGDLTHRAYVVDSSEGPSTGLAQEHMEKQCSEELGKNVFTGDADNIPDVTKEVFEENAEVQHEGQEKAILF